MTILCAPFVSVPTNAYSWLSLDISAESAAALLRTKDVLAAARTSLNELEDFRPGDQAIEVPLHGLSLALFDDERISDLSGAADMLQEEWATVPDGFEPNEETAFDYASGRFGSTELVVVFHPDHYKGTADGLPISYEVLAEIAAGKSPFAELELPADDET